MSRTAAPACPGVPWAGELGMTNPLGTPMFGWWAGAADEVVQPGVAEPDAEEPPARRAAGASVAGSGQVRAEQGQVGQREPVASGLGLVPEGVDERRGAGLVEPGPLVAGEGEVRRLEVVG